MTAWVLCALIVFIYSYTHSMEEAGNKGKQWSIAVWTLMYCILFWPLVLVAGLYAVFLYLIGKSPSYTIC